MNVDQLWNVLKAEPFRPFVIHLTNGRAFRVKHPELVSPSQTGRTLIIWGSGESFDVVDGLHVADIEVPNGKSSRRRP